MTKYIIGEIFSSGGATLYKNPSDQTVCTFLTNMDHCNVLRFRYFSKEKMNSNLLRAMFASQVTQSKSTLMINANKDLKKMIITGRWV